MKLSKRYYSLVKELAFFETSISPIDEDERKYIVNQLKELSEKSTLTYACDRWFVIYADGSTREPTENEVYDVYEARQKGLLPPLLPPPPLPPRQKRLKPLRWVSPPIEDVDLSEPKLDNLTDIELPKD